MFRYGRTPVFWLRRTLALKLHIYIGKQCGSPFPFASALAANCCCSKFNSTILSHSPTVSKHLNLIPIISTPPPTKHQCPDPNASNSSIPRQNSTRSIHVRHFCSDVLSNVLAAFISEGQQHAYSVHVSSSKRVR
jgi:hypothetical protein